MTERDLDKNPYSPDEQRVAAFFFERGTGGGDDPIGSILAGHQYLADQRNALQAVFDAAFGLCMGYDWNNGTAAKHCGYRRKLLSAVNAIKPIPDFETKYSGSSRPVERTP